MLMKLGIPVQKSLWVRKSIIEWTFIMLLFICSFVNSIASLVTLSLSVILLLQKEVGAIKILNLIALRTVINPYIAPDIGVWQNIKWVIILVCSVYLLLSYFKLDKMIKYKIRWIIATLFIFTVYNAIIAITVSSLPTIAIFKTISYALVCLGVIIGVAYTKDKINWLNWVFKIFFVFMMISFLTMPLPISRMLNGSFQGLSNQPNMFGILTALFLALLLTYSHINKTIKPIPLSILVAIVFLMVFECKSRTSLISTSVILLTYLGVTLPVKFTYLKAAIISFVSAMVVLSSLIFWEPLSEFLVGFMAKGQTTDDLLASRQDQLGTLVSAFKEHPIFGNGFMVPVLPTRTWVLNMNFIVEPGNLIMSLLSFTGIAGFVIFLSYLFSIFVARKNKFSPSLTLFIAPILISMGEMVFFSSNNIGTWCYMLLALYVFADKNKQTTNVR